MHSFNGSAFVRRAELRKRCIHTNHSTGALTRSAIYSNVNAAQSHIWSDSRRSNHAARGKFDRHLRISHHLSCEAANARSFNHIGSSVIRHHGNSRV